LENPYENLLDINVKTCIGNFSKKDQVYFQRFNKNLVKSKSLNDKKEKPKTIIVYSFDKANHYPIEISFFRPTKPFFELIANFRIIRFFEEGLINMEILNFNFNFGNNPSISTADVQKKLLKQVFFDIRDMYHKQTHAIDNGIKEEMPDSLTQPSFKTVQTDALKEIVQFHQQKVHEYNNFNIGLMAKSQHMEGDKDVIFDSAILRRQAKGCFIYALNFIEFYKVNFTPQEYGRYIQIFNNAILAMEAFCEEIDTFYNSKTSENLKALSILSIVIGSILAFLSVIDITFSDRLGTNTPLLWMFNAFFIIIIVLYYISVVTDIKLIQ
jgi:hypothetical protein